MCVLRVRLLKCYNNGVGCIINCITLLTSNLTQTSSNKGEVGITFSLKCILIGQNTF